jgi:hypothetical protein
METTTALWLLVAASVTIYFMFYAIKDNDND